MCDQEAFARLRDQTERNTQAISELAKTDAVQSEQIKTLFAVTEKQGKTIDTITTRLVMAVLGVLGVTVLALVFGAIGEKGFNAVVHETPTLQPGGK